MTDLQIGLAKETNQHQKMEEFVRELDSKECAGFHFTGHSLGGNVATHGAVYLGDPDKGKRVVTFNSPGFNTYYRTIHSNHIKGIEDKVVNYHNEGDYVSSIEVSFGEIVIVKTTSGYLDYGFSQ